MKNWKSVYFYKPFREKATFTSYSFSWGMGPTLLYFSCGQSIFQKCLSLNIGLRIDNVWAVLFTNSTEAVFQYYQSYQFTLRISCQQFGIFWWVQWNIFLLKVWKIMITNYYFFQSLLFKSSNWTLLERC